MTEGWKEGLEVEGVDRQLLPPAGSRSGRVMQHRCRAGGGSYRRDKLLRSQTKLVAGLGACPPCLHINIQKLVASHKRMSKCASRSESMLFDYILGREV